FRDKNNGHANSGSLPDELSPVTNLRQLSIQNTSDQSILSADITAPEKFVFFLKRDLGSNNIHASLQINSETHKARLRLAASGLTANADYSLALNNAVVATSASNDKGKLAIGW